MANNRVSGILNGKQFPLNLLGLREYGVVFWFGFFYPFLRALIT